MTCLVVFRDFSLIPSFIFNDLFIKEAAGRVRRHKNICVAPLYCLNAEGSTRRFFDTRRISNGPRDLRNVQSRVTLVSSSPGYYVGRGKNAEDLDGQRDNVLQENPAIIKKKKKSERELMVSLDLLYCYKH